MAGSRKESLWPFLDHLAGWLMLVVGVLMLATAALAPDRRSVEQLARHRDLMKLQTDTIVDQAEAYRRFHAAVEDRDPVLMRRLACDQLRLKPVGASLFAAHGAAASEATPPLEGGVAAWLQKPIATMLADSDHGTSPPGRTLKALTSGPARLGLVGCGTVCVVIGLLLPLGPRSGKA